MIEKREKRPLNFELLGIPPLSGSIYSPFNSNIDREWAIGFSLVPCGSDFFKILLLVFSSFINTKLTVIYIEGLILWIRKFSQEFNFLITSHMRSFVKIQPSRIGYITLWFTYIGKSCHDRDFFTLQMCLLTLFAKIKFSRKFLSLQ